ncbi:FkbM family methyltransferase [Chloroflexota bacterium]
MSHQIILALFNRASRFLSGKGIGIIPGATALYDFIFWHLCPHKSILEIQGNKMYMNPKNLPKRFRNTFKYFTKYQIHEELTTELFKKVVKDGDIVVDLGANVGYFTLLASKLVGKEGRVYAFEPEPLNYSILIKNIELNGYKNIISVQKAVSGICGTVKLFIDEKATGCHTLSQYDDKKEFIEVDSVTLDNFFKDRNHPVNVIKMDIQGAEIAALMGMDRIIEQNDNLKIFAEFNPSLIQGMGHSAEEFVRMLLEKWHFSVRAISEQAKNRSCLQINSVSELMDLFMSRNLKHVNLFVEKNHSLTIL